jgi:GrpB-like predicted nucleotidyltransferase (UPF0157 family)
MPVKVVSYNPEWKRWFTELSEPIREQIDDYIIDILHVGSTSIEGMSAKPIIDIDVVIDHWKNFQEIAKLLEDLGYEHQGKLGIKQREAFKQIRDSKYPHHLYVCHKDSIAYKNHMLLKKHLLENPEDFRRYQELKRTLGNIASNVDIYTRLKTELILEFLAAEGVSDEELNEIRSENLS